MAASKHHKSHSWLDDYIAISRTHIEKKQAKLESLQMKNSKNSERIELYASIYKGMCKLDKLILKLSSSIYTHTELKRDKLTLYSEIYLNALKANYDAPSANYFDMYHEYMGYIDNIEAIFLCQYDSISRLLILTMQLCEHIRYKSTKSTKSDDSDDSDSSDDSDDSDNEGASDYISVEVWIKDIADIRTLGQTILLYQYTRFDSFTASGGALKKQLYDLYNTAAKGMHTRLPKSTIKQLAQLNNAPNNPAVEIQAALVQKYTEITDSCIKYIDMLCVTYAAIYPAALRIELNYVKYIVKEILIIFD
jgi:hypothetical protein